MNKVILAVNAVLVIAVIGLYAMHFGEDKSSPLIEENIVEEIGHVKYSRPDERSRIADVMLVPLDKTAVIVIARDITDSLEMEKRLQQSEKMEAIGTLAGGIAHDFNNLLVGVIGNADLLRNMEPVSVGGMQCLDGIIRSAETAAGLSRKMLAYARKQPAMKRVID